MNSKLPNDFNVRLFPGKFVRGRTTFKSLEDFYPPEKLDAFVPVLIGIAGLRGPCSSAPTALLAGFFDLPPSCTWFSATALGAVDEAPLPYI